jgi:hypothetical protein
MNSVAEIVEEYRTDLSLIEREMLIAALSDLDYFSAKDVGLLYGVHPATVKRWIHEQRVSAVPGYKWLMPRDSVLRIKFPKIGRPRVLTSAAARVIKESRERNIDLARRYGVSPSLITLIQKGERYPDV